MSATPFFNFIPGTGLVAPLFAFEVNSGELFEAINRFVLLGHGDGTGTGAANTPAQITSLNQADALAGPNSMLREMVRVALLNAPALPIWIVPVAAAGAAAVWTGTIAAFSGTGVAALEIEGETIQVSVGVADTPTTVAAALAAAINAYWNPLTGKKLAITATSAIGVITMTARFAGVIANSIDIYLPQRIQGNVLAQAGVWTLAVGTAGSGTPSLAAALAALGDSPADFIVAPWSDATSLAAYAATTNDTSGRWSWARQSYGHVWSLFNGSTSAATTLGLSLNDRHLSLPWVANLPTPDWTVCSALSARLAPWLLDTVGGNVSRSQTGLVVQGVRSPRNPANWPGWAQRNIMLQSGVSTWKVDQSGNFCIDKIITTAQFGPQSQPDVTFRDVQSVYQVAGSLAFIRAALASEQGNKAIADSNPGSLLSIATTKDIAATIIHAYQQLNMQGVMDDPDDFAEAIVVARDAANPARVNVYAPMTRIDPLDIIAANATIYAQLSAAA